MNEQPPKRRLGKLFFIPSYFKKTQSNASELSSSSDSSSVGSSSSSSNFSADCDEEDRGMKTLVVVDSPYDEMMPIPYVRVIPVDTKVFTIPQYPQRRTLQRPGDEATKQQEPDDDEEDQERMGRIFCGAGDTAFELSLQKRSYKNNGKRVRFQAPPPSVPSSSASTATVNASNTTKEFYYQQRIQDYEFFNDTIEFVAAELANVPETLSDEVCAPKKTTRAEEKAFDHAVRDLMLLS